MANTLISSSPKPARGPGSRAHDTNLDPTVAGSDFVIGSYHRLFQIEKSLADVKHDLQARPIYHHKRESIDAHLTVVFAALAASKFIETETSWSIENSAKRRATNAPLRSKPASTHHRRRPAA